MYQGFRKEPLPGALLWRRTTLKRPQIFFGQFDATYLECYLNRPFFFPLNFEQTRRNGRGRIAENEKYEIKCDRLWILLRIYDVYAHIAEMQPSCPNAHITRTHTRTNTHM